MTTPENHDDILATLRAILRLLGWLGGPALLLLIGLMISDHYAAVDLKRNDKWMMPRVTRMWLEKHPEIQPDEVPQWNP